MNRGRYPIGRQPSRAWPLVALIAVAAVATNASFPVRIEPVGHSSRPAPPPDLVDLPWPSRPAPPASDPPPTIRPLAVAAPEPTPAPEASPLAILDPKLARTALTTGFPTAPPVPAAEPKMGPPPTSTAPSDAQSAPADAPSAPDPTPPPLEVGIAPLPPAPGPDQAQATGPVPPASESPTAPAPEAAAISKPGRDPAVEPTACATCGGYHPPTTGPGLGEMVGCLDGLCIPGRTPCNLPFPESQGVFTGAINNLYQCLCCPDPCYQPRWVPAANASFFVDYARPRTVTRIRYDNLENLVRPDRNSFWISQVQAIKTPKHRITNLSARLQQAYIYQEAAGPRGSFFIEYPYRQINPSYEPTQAGFGDMNFGVKSLFFDCEMLQLTFQFRTYAPTGNSSLGLGTGHFSLDPSILAALKLGPDTYVQGQYGNWIPLGGNTNLAGGMFYWLTSLNQVLWYVTPESPLIGTLELDGWSFENGGYTGAIPKGASPGGTYSYVEKGGGVSYFNIGPGLRQSVCNRLDFGGAITWATSNIHWAQPWFRFEVRFLF